MGPHHGVVARQVQRSSRRLPGGVRGYPSAPSFFRKLFGGSFRVVLLYALVGGAFPLFRVLPPFLAKGSYVGIYSLVGMPTVGGNDDFTDLSVLSPSP